MGLKGVCGFIEGLYWVYIRLYQVFIGLRFRVSGYLREACENQEHRTSQDLGVWVWWGSNYRKGMKSKAICG